VLTALTLSNTAFSSESIQSIHHDSTQGTLAVFAINEKIGTFHVRESYDMGISGVQQIDYIIDCENKTMALVNFAVQTTKVRLTSNKTEDDSADIIFYLPKYEHDQRISNNVCNKLVTLNISGSK
jgi:hypothetical protein